MDLDSLLQDVVSPAARTSLQEVAALERLAPELLPYEAAVVDDTISRLRDQIDAVEHGSTGLASIIQQSDIERVRYLLRSYMRTRLWKIDHYAQGLMASPDQRGKLSQMEQQYLDKHGLLLTRHFEKAVLDRVPASGNLRRVNDRTAAGVSMIDAPDLNQFVFALARRSVECRAAISETIQARAGQIMLIPYAAVAQHIPHSVVLL